ncbi:serine/arginine-rich splicing factor SR45-like [Miscanthus floridulus]|uniref:serine/arginine-rich splicing factor SR45-like n=1 Tax=Miscanthus floridulus TaxID=154761 RepID=UPI00345829CB
MRPGSPSHTDKQPPRTPLPANAAPHRRSQPSPRRRSPKPARPRAERRPPLPVRRACGRPRARQPPGRRRAPRAAAPPHPAPRAGARPHAYVWLSVASSPTPAHQRRRVEEGRRRRGEEARRRRRRGRRGGGGGGGGGGVGPTPGARQRRAHRSRVEVPVAVPVCLHHVASPLHRSTTAPLA